MDSEFGRLGSVLEAGDGDGDGGIVVFQTGKNCSPELSDSCCVSVRKMVLVGGSHTSVQYVLVICFVRVLDESFGLSVGVFLLQGLSGC